ncbi:MAG: 23S rRNA (uracil(1939)-C(5))-methyltransferase RlmD [Synergistaceae bacterium]|jgi:23S rRNA (uracil1939-C5)-methyltransferase|nr:23S rRNA (uracil(1939)-C(5))-methyltransferase RlmD [Synergistaceae bacterium]
MREKETLHLEIENVNSEGDGVARVDMDGRGFVVFVGGVLPGERVKCRVERMSKNYAAASVSEILTPSPDRVPPKCANYGVCGGCQTQHASYEAQLRMKKGILTDAMRRIGKIDAGGDLSCAPSPAEWGYRNKTVLPVGHSAGYYARRSHRIVPFSGCPVLDPSLELVLTKLISSHRSSGLSGYDEKNGLGDVRAVAARMGQSEGETGIIAGVVAAHELNRRQFGALRDAHQKLMNEIKPLKGSTLNIKTSRDNFVWGPAFTSLCGSRFVTAGMDGYKFRLDISAFFQINAPQAKRIFSLVRDIVKNSGASKVLELYSGTGSLTSYLSSVCDSVDAVEEWRLAVKLMNGNMERNGIGNVRVFAESAEGFMSDPENVGRGAYDAIVLDPPRAGAMAAVINGIRLASPEKVIYISCNPAALARDASMICGGGEYELESLAAYDMFPQTAHVESVCVLTKRKNNASMSIASGEPAGRRTYF